MNDTLRTDVSVRYNPETIACACIYLSARQLGIVMPRKPARYLLFSCVEQHLKDICIRIVKLYTRPKPNADELKKIVAQLEQAYQQSRHRSKHVIPDGGSVTPNNNKSQSALSPSFASLVTALVQNKVVSTESAGSTPSVVKGDDKDGNHVTKKSMKTESPVGSCSRSPSPSPSDKHDKERRHKSRHHHHHWKKRSRSRSRSRSVEKGGRRDREREPDKKKTKRDTSDKRDSRHHDRDRERDKERGEYKYRKNKDRDREKDKERRHRDRSLSRDRRR